MAYLTRGLLGIVAVAATLGAVQMASGQNVAQRNSSSQIRAGHDPVASANVAGINRENKSDRAALASTASRSQTLSISVGGVDATSILVRVPLAAVNNDAKRLPSMLQPAAARRAPVACEPMVSALSEVARQLQPGRCVT